MGMPNTKDFNTVSSLINLIKNEIGKSKHLPNSFPIFYRLSNKRIPSEKHKSNEQLASYSISNFQSRMGD